MIIIIGAGPSLHGVALPPWNDRPMIQEGPVKRDKKVKEYTYVYICMCVYVYICIDL
jgi:hypothetical protein